MTLIKSRLLNIFLHNILSLILFNLTGIKLIFLILSNRKTILLGSLYALFNLYKLIHFGPVAFSILIKTDSQLLYLTHDEDSSSLWPWFRLADIQYWWVFLRLSLCHLTIFNNTFPFLGLLFWILLYIMKLSRVHPSHWKELKLFWEFFLKPFQMHG